CGDPIRVDRVGRSSVIVPEPAITILVTAQPEVTRTLSFRAGFRGQGLMARFLYASPRSTVGSRDPNPPPVPPATRERDAGSITRLLTLSEPSVGELGGRCLPLRLGEEADRLRVRLTKGLEPHLADPHSLEPIADWGSKYVGTVLRIAGLLHVAELVE